MGIFMLYLSVLFRHGMTRVEIGRDGLIWMACGWHVEGMEDMEDMALTFNKPSLRIGEIQL